ncbi:MULTISPECIES: hypothetical protein [unclassified Microcoleus]|uniref:hypothetical protein n=1 Tax=unclassified Microcoleus TaxID=2642155 RepID=UPI002FD3E674
MPETTNITSYWSFDPIVYDSLYGQKIQSVRGGTLSLQSDGGESISIDYLWGRRSYYNSPTRPMDSPEIEDYTQVFAQDPNDLYWWEITASSPATPPPCPPGQICLKPADTGVTNVDEIIYYLALGNNINPDRLLLEKSVRQIDNSNPSLDDAVFSLLIQQPYKVSGVREIFRKEEIKVDLPGNPRVPNPSEPVPEPSLLFSSLAFGAVSIWMRKQRGKLKAARK